MTNWKKVVMSGMLVLSSLFSHGADKAKDSAPSTVLLESNFASLTAQPREVNGKGYFKGVLPEGWSENFTGWTEVRATTVPVAEGDVKFLRFNIEKIPSAGAQFCVPLPGVKTGKTYCVTIRIRTSDSDAVRIAFREIGIPYASLWGTMVNTAGEWQQKEFVFKVTHVVDKPIGLFLYCSDPDVFDLAYVKVEEISMVKVAAAISRPDAGVKNFFRNSRLPLGLQSGWNIDRELFDGSAVADTTQTGPSGCAPLKITGKAGKFALFSEPFNVSDSGQTNQISFAVKGEGSWQASVICKGRVIKSKKLNVNGSWQRDAIIFTPDPEAWSFSLRLEGTGTLYLDALRACAGDKTAAYIPAGKCEVAMTFPPSATADSRIQFVDEKPLVNYLVSGDADGGELNIKIVNLYGESKELPPVRLNAGNLAGSINYDVFPNHPLGQFRIELSVKKDGALISPYNELVATRLDRPVYWGKDAPDSPFGIHVIAQEQLLKALKAGGVNWTRLHDAGTNYIGWFWLEPEKGKWVFADDAIQTYRRNNIKIIGQLGTAPKWASYLSMVDTGRSWISYHDHYFQPKNQADFANYVTTVVSRYRGVIDEYFIWNEPWNAAWWGVAYDKSKPGTDGHITSKNPQADFATLMKTAYQASKAAAPEVKIAGFNSGGKNWTRGVYDAGGMTACDIIDYHAYTDRMTGYPGDYCTQEYLNSIGYILEKEKSRLNKPVYMTEGQGTSQGNASGDDTQRFAGIYKYTVPWNNQENVIRYADNNCRFVVSTLASGAAKVFLYTAHSYNNLSTVPTFLVLTSADGYPHPMLAAHSAMAKRLEDKKFDKTKELAPGLYAYIFSDGKNSCAVISGKNSARGKRVAADLPGCAAADLFGNPLTLPLKYEGTIAYISVQASAVDLYAKLKAE